MENLLKLHKNTQNVLKRLNIIKPALLLDSLKVKTNIKNMVQKSKKAGLRFRPHFKTHQSAEIGSWFKRHNVNAITVSSIDMAMYFANNGWDDITIAFPVNINQIDDLNRMAKSINLNLLVESVEVVSFLENNLNSGASIWIKIDCGYNRTGVLWTDTEKIAEISNAVIKSGKLKFEGILTHAGNSYHGESPNDIASIFTQTSEKMAGVRDELTDRNIQAKISVGDTPGCTVVNDFSGIDEIRPGNFVFFDLTQWMLGVCTEQDIAIAAACPVVAKHPERNEIIVHGGAVHLSKESIKDRNGNMNFGTAVFMADNGWGNITESIYIKSVSQEHGIVKAGTDFINEVMIGDFLLFLPVHSCLTANLLKKFHTLDGKIIEMMP